MILTRDGTLVVSGGGGVMRTWKVGGSTSSEPGPPVAAARQIAVSADAMLVALLDDAGIDIRRTSDLSFVKRIAFDRAEPTLSLPLSGIRFSTDGATLAANSGAHYGQWRTSDWTELANAKPVPPTNGGVTPVDVQKVPLAVIADSGSVVTYDEKVRGLVIRRMTDYSPARIVRGHAAPIGDVAFTPDGTGFVTASPDYLQLIRVSDGVAVESLIRPDTAGMYAFARLSSDGRRLAIIDGGGISLWCRPGE
jgi:WD40 repeat protein